MPDAPLLDLVMLVDDDPDENFVNKRTLTRSKLTQGIVAFESPHDALDWLRDTGNGRVDLIILDINMPQMSGFEFLEQYAGLPPDRQARTVIMLLTASLNPRDMARAEEYADTVYQNKPLRPEMIVAALAEKPRKAP